MRKMYILIKDNIPRGLSITAAAHASLSLFLKYQETEEIADWLRNSFRKVVCQVNEQEFQEAKAMDISKVILTESALDGKETAIAFLPLEEFPPQFKYYPLWK